MKRPEMSRISTRLFERRIKSQHNCQRNTGVGDVVHRRCLHSIERFCRVELQFRNPSKVCCYIRDMTSKALSTDGDAFFEAGILCFYRREMKYVTSHKSFKRWRRDVLERVRVSRSKRQNLGFELANDEQTTHLLRSRTCQNAKRNRSGVF